MINKSDKPKSGWNLPPDLKYHFIGIGGVAMGQVAVDLKECGFKVTGSDMGVYSPMKEILEDAGIETMSPFSAENVRDAELVIAGNAISRGNVELEEVLSKRIPYTSMVELVRWGVLQSRKNLVITGTHGKTTTTALTAHILESGGFDPGYMIGGRPFNFDSGFSSKGTEWFAVEGDEYDIAFFDKRPKFLQYLPFGVVINNIEYDHADIYESLEQILDGFRKLMRIVPENGVLVINADDENILQVLSEARCKTVTFGLKAEADFTGRLENGAIEIVKGGQLWGKTGFSLPGEYNLKNALAAAALLDEAGIPEEVILSGLSSFKSVNRRMEFKGEAGGITVYDDFAHHPTAVKAAIGAVKEMHPGRKVRAIFQPRSNTSVTNIYQREWEEAFSQADFVVIAELHRKEKIPAAKRLSRSRIKENLEKQGKPVYLWDTAEIILHQIGEHLRSGEVILVMSNSSFDNLAERLVELVKQSHTDDTDNTDKYR